MAFVTGLQLIDAPASALNNAGIDQGRADQNVVLVKAIQSGKDRYPYVSAQAYRYWLRTGLPEIYPRWINSPTYREADNLAYTAADPIEYWDDDLFGYMRAPKGDSRKRRDSDPEYAKLTPLSEEKRKDKTVEVILTRVSPFRVSTLVSVAPVYITEHQESMSRHEGNPVLFEAQFYRTTLQGLFSLNLNTCGSFSYRNRTGFRNLDDVRMKKIEGIPGHEHLQAEKVYRLPQIQRLERVKALLEGMARIEGGAKQALHYTDVAPALVVLAVTKGGNHIFAHVVGADRNGQPAMKLEALQESLRVFGDELLSDIYVGWTKGYLDDQRVGFEKFVAEYNPTAHRKIVINHPREAFHVLAEAFDTPENAGWLA